MSGSEILNRALSLNAGGIGTIPTGADKRPAFDVLPDGWDIYKSELALADELHQWFPNGSRGMAVIGGAVSGNLLTLDFDLPEGYPPETPRSTLDKFLSLIDELIPGILDRLEVVKTRKGFHVRLRCAGPVGGNRKLAMTPKLAADGTVEVDRWDRPRPATLIETRGEGGYALQFPTPGYEHIGGPRIEDAQRVTSDELQVILGVARQFDRMPTDNKPEPSRAETSTPAEPSCDSGLRPGDDYNQRAEWEPLLADLDLEVVGKTSDGITRLHRRGSTNPIAATLGFGGSDLLYAFSTGLDLPSERSYDKFAVYTLLYHRGDFRAASAALRKLGYGSQPADVVNTAPPAETSVSESNERRRRHKPENSAENGPSVATPSAVDPFHPFPTGVLPEPLRGFVLAGATSIGCDPAFLAVSLLVICAAAIGNSRRVRLKRGWSEPPILWAALLGESGGHKSPALELALRAVRRLQRQALKRYQAEYDQWLRIDMPQFEKELAEWKRSKGGGEPPVRPDEPVPWRILCDDATIEALAGLLQKQPRGLLLTADELASWLGSFDRYKGKGAGGDAAKWLEVHGGRQLLVDRKTGQKLLCIPHASVCVLGGIQPGVLRRMMTAEHRESGMGARLLVTFPPRRRKQWSEADVSPEAEAAIEELITRLLRMELVEDRDGELAPQLIELSAEAKSEFVRFYNANADEQSALTGDLCATWSKLEAYGPRLALVIHCIRWAAGDSSVVKEDEIDVASMTAGIALARWFGHEARRVHALCGETDEQRETRELVEWVSRQGGRVTSRDLQHRGPRRFRGSAGVADEALSGLVAAGLGTWETVDTDGRPRTEFVLPDPPGDRRSVSQAEKGASVAVASDCVPKITIGARRLTEDEADRLADAF